MQLKIQLCDALILQDWECGSQTQSLTVQHMYCIRVCFRERGEFLWPLFKLLTDHWQWCAVRAAVLHHWDRHLWSTPSFPFDVTLTIFSSPSTAHTARMCERKCVCVCMCVYARVCILSLCCNPVCLEAPSLFLWNKGRCCLHHKARPNAL